LFVTVALTVSDAVSFAAETARGNRVILSKAPSAAVLFMTVPSVRL
jgi:hypothetical protein